VVGVGLTAKPRKIIHHEICMEGQFPQSAVEPMMMMMMMMMMI
jgi:hypothetical protein